MAKQQPSSSSNRMPTMTYSPTASMVTASEGQSVVTTLYCAHASASTNSAGKRNSRWRLPQFAR